MPRREPVSWQARAELFNVFNHEYFPQPATSGYASGNTGVSSFGRLNFTNDLGSSQFRTAQLVARFEF